MNPILFWSNTPSTKSIQEWRNERIDLFPAHFLTLESYNRLDYPVKLYTYQIINPKSVPVNVEILDAGEFYSEELAFDALIRGHSIAHVSDLIRFAAASKYTGAIMDLDAVVLRDLPDEGFFASSPAKLTGAFAPHWGAAHPPLYVSDKSWDGKALSDFPVGIDEDMRDFSNKIVELIGNTLKRKPRKSSKGWCFVMYEFQKYHEKLRKRVYEPLYFSPLPAWLPKGKCYSLEHPTRLGNTSLFGYRMPSIDEILENSFCVKHCFDSVYRKANYYKEDFWNTVHTDSLLGREARFVLGSNWRKVLLGK